MKICGSCKFYAAPQQPPPLKDVPKQDPQIFKKSGLQRDAALVTPAGAVDFRTPDQFSLGLSDLFAHDLAGRARAFQSMVGGGMEVSKVAAMSGLMEGER